MEKTCSKCGMVKPLDEYHKRKAVKDGRQASCKKCHNEYCRHSREKYAERDREYRRANKDKKAAYDLEYREKNRITIRERQRKYAERTREEKAEYDRKYREINKEKLIENKRKDWQKNRERYIEKQRGYWQRNKEHLREYHRNYKREKCQNDIGYRMGKNLRTRLYRFVKGSSKSAPSMELIGCTIEELKAYLESQFQPGMSWDNYTHDGWHIDHRIPCASFDLTDPEQQKTCFNYKNLQPLWAKDNMSKGAKL